ncbi:MAG: hypothetical protein F4X44_03945 [Gammaproteobacteria bacterium]|nr:hypothetical protein [Gammaproteobacteria bacterium]
MLKPLEKSPGMAMPSPFEHLESLKEEEAQSKSLVVKSTLQPCTSTDSRIDVEHIKTNDMWIQSLTGL